MTTIAPTPVPNALASHSFRRTIGHPELTCTLHPDALVVTSDTGQPPRVYPLQGIRRVHLTYVRGRARADYWCELRTDQGKVGFRQNHFAGLANIQDRSATYKTLVLGLLQALQGRPEVRMTSGSWAGFIGLLLLAPLIVGLIVLGVRWGSTRAIVGGSVLLLALLVNIGRIRPRTFTADAPPRGLLPR